MSDVAIDNIQQITDAVQKGLLQIVRASVQQGRTRLTLVYCRPSGWCTAIQIRAGTKNS